MDNSNDVLIYELQYWLEKAEKLLRSIRADSNPLYLKRQATSYFNDKKRKTEK
tara:strand:- start:2999 stop:3157 length:159 start_codon:yes stop_codon:yes gene_type:complete